MGLAEIISIIAGIFIPLTIWLLNQFEKSIEKLHKKIIDEKENIEKNIDSKILIVMNEYYIGLDAQIQHNRNAIAFLKEEIRHQTKTSAMRGKTLSDKLLDIEKDLDNIKEK